MKPKTIQFYVDDKKVGKPIDVKNLNNHFDTIKLDIECSCGEKIVVNLSKYDLIGLQIEKRSLVTTLKRHKIVYVNTYPDDFHYTEEEALKCEETNNE